MPVDIFSTAFLAKVVASLDEPASFLLNTFFPSEQTSDTEEIYFDVESKKRRITPFVSPLLPGKVVAGPGIATKSFRPAYAKDKRRFDATSGVLKRRIGEKIGGASDPMTRRQAALGLALKDQLEMLTQREEVMASEALRLGTVTVSGDEYPTTVVNFGRDAALTVTLSGGTRWGEAGVKPLANLKAWHRLVMQKSGASAVDVVMDPLAWELFEADEAVITLLNRQAYRQAPSLELEPVALKQGEEKAQYMGSVGVFRIWVYQDTYYNDALVATNILPDYTVMLNSRSQVDGVRCYGVIFDEKINYKAQRYFTKSWVEEDPPVRWLLLTSAPLVVPYRPNATFCATVR